MGEAAIIGVFGTRSPRITAVRQGFMPGDTGLDVGELARRPDRMEARDLVLDPGAAFTGRVLSGEVVAVGTVINAIPSLRGAKSQLRVYWADGAGAFARGWSAGHPPGPGPDG